MIELLRVWRVGTSLLFVCLAAWLAGSCRSGDQTSEEQMREIQNRMEASLPQRQQDALAQDVDLETVRTVQRQLRAVNEYMDEPDGELDDVTVNAIQAFQRRVGLRDDGMLTERTLRRLREEAAPTRAGDDPSSGPPS